MWFYVSCAEQEISLLFRFIQTKCTFLRSKINKHSDVLCDGINVISSLIASKRARSGKMSAALKKINKMAVITAALLVTIFCFYDTSYKTQNSGRKKKKTITGSGTLTGISSTPV